MGNEGSAGSSFLKAGPLAMALALLVAVTGATAQDQPGSLALQLNGLAPSEKGCRLTFVVKNELRSPLETASFEIVLFNKEGLVERMTVIEFRDLPEGKTKVEQFDLPGADCGRVDRILVNDAAECTGAGLAPDACIRHLTTETKSAVTFGS
jgi:hypothetical protein